jgi:hypothetical protein
MTDLESKVLNWFATGEVGLSSRCMASALTGRAFDGSHPHDPDDFYRCYKLLVAVPELRPRLHWLARISREWSTLVAHWDEIERTLIDEIGADGKKGLRAPRTYELMFALLHPVVAKKEKEEQPTNDHE